jgi:hypothetical protein
MKVVYKRYKAEKLSPTSKNFIYLWSRFSKMDRHKEFDMFLDGEFEVLATDDSLETCLNYEI